MDRRRWTCCSNDGSGDTTRFEYYLQKIFVFYKNKHNPITQYITQYSVTYWTALLVRCSNSLAVNISRLIMLNNNNIIVSTRLPLYVAQFAVHCAPSIPSNYHARTLSQHTTQHTTHNVYCVLHKHTAFLSVFSIGWSPPARSSIDYHSYWPRCVSFRLFRTTCACILATNCADASKSKHTIWRANKRTCCSPKLAPTQRHEQSDKWCWHVFTCTSNGAMCWVYIINDMHARAWNVHSICVLCICVS